MTNANPDLRLIRTDPAEQRLLTPVARRRAWLLGVVGAAAAFGYPITLAAVSPSESEGPTVAYTHTVKSGESLSGIENQLTKKLRAKGDKVTFSEIQSDLRAVEPGVGAVQNPNQLMPGDVVEGRVPTNK